MSNKTLYEIYDDICNNKPVEEEDLRLGLLVYRSLLWFANNDVEILYNDTNKNPFSKARFEQNVMRYKKALDTTPKHWLGNENIPGTQEYMEKTKIFKNILIGYKKWKEREKNE